jgi:hypothetical protein
LFNDEPEGGRVAFTPPALRRLALAVAVLYDVDLCPDPTGLQIGPDGLQVDWSVVADAVQSAQDARGSNETVLLDALAAWLRARLAIAAGATLCALGMPARHVTNPGPGWIRERVPGGSLSLGFGYQPAADDPVVALPLGVLEHAGLGPQQLALSWKHARADLEELGRTAVERDRRHRAGPLKPVHGADVVTLLGAKSLRTELAAGEGDGMAALIVPLRVRGWRANSIVDPAYGPAVAAAMSLEERGFERPILVTAEEVSEVRPGGNPMRLLREESEPST